MLPSFQHSNKFLLAFAFHKIKFHIPDPQSSGEQEELKNHTHAIIFSIVTLHYSQLFKK